jgi:hypothetical protein
MSTLPFAAARQTDAESWPSESADAPRAETKAEATIQTQPADVRQQVLGLKKKLEEAASEFGHLQTNLASQQQLEQLLRQGRTHLQDLRTRLQQVTAERDRLDAELTEHKAAHRIELDRLQNQIEETARQHERDIASKEQEHQFQVEALEEHLNKTTAERNRLTVQLEDREASYKQFADERSEERFTFERLLAEATANQREMVRELDEQRQQIETLREAAMRAQSLAREIMRAHEGLSPEDSNP